MCAGRGRGGGGGGWTKLLPPAPPYYPFPRGKPHTRGIIRRPAPEYSSSLRHIVCAGRGGWTKQLETSIAFWSLNPAAGFESLNTLARSVVVTSGTLSPLETFASELGTEFPISMEMSHVISKERVWVGTVPVSLPPFLNHFFFFFFSHFSVYGVVSFIRLVFPCKHRTICVLKTCWHKACFFRYILRYMHGGTHMCSETTSYKRKCVLKTRWHKACFLSLYFGIKLELELECQRSAILKNCK